MPLIYHFPKRILHDLDDFIVRQLPTGIRNFLEQLPTCQVLDHKINRVLGLVHLPQFNDIRMVQFPHDGYLIDQRVLSPDINKTSSPKETYLSFVLRHQKLFTEGLDRILLVIIFSVIDQINLIF
jgi:hypothetical protein